MNKSKNKKVKVKSLAEKYGISPKEILRELQEEGIEVKGASSVIPPEFLELIEDHLNDLKKNPRSKKTDDESSAQSSEDEVHIKSPIVVKALAEALNKKPNEVISALMTLGVLASINQTVEADAAIKVSSSFGINLAIDKREKSETKPKLDIPSPEDVVVEDDPKDLQPRPPVVTFMGHVDHGKTSLQDKVRSTSIVDGEAGGITQHIGASVVKYNDHDITFIDTPGHAAFTAMRERGAGITDITILVIAADDGFMPQTIEAMNHAKAAGTPIIVAINKIDLPGADPDKIILQMQQNSLMSEDWGGDVAAVRVSAMTGEGIDDLLERIILEAELLELKANPKRPAQAIVIESQVEVGQGPTASILINNGTLHVGDIILCGTSYGRVKAMEDSNGKRIKKAGPSTPVKIMGLSSAPETGAKAIVVKNEKEAKRLVSLRTHEVREKTLALPEGSSLEDLFSTFEEQQSNNLKMIIKSDVRGSGEAIQTSLQELPSDKIKVNVITNTVGSISENDVMLAATSGAIIVGFHVRVNPGVNAIAKQKGVEIRLYSIIYELIEDIKEALTGRLAPEKREKSLGEAKILQIFSTNKGPNICGCMVETGAVKVGVKARVYRDGELIFNGDVTSLRRFQDDVKEVRQGLECGIRLDNFKDFLVDDKIEFYEIEFKKAKL